MIFSEYKILYPKYPTNLHIIFLVHKQSFRFASKVSGYLDIFIHDLKGF